MEYRIKDFVDRPCVKVTAEDYTDHLRCGEMLVVVISDFGPMRFQGNFTPAQARELANALNDCADTLEVIAERKREVAQEVES